MTDLKIQKLDFKDLGLESFFKSEDTEVSYEILSLLVSDGIPYQAKYFKYISYSSEKDFMSNLSKEDMYGILKYTMADGKLINKDNFDQIFSDSDEAMAVIMASLLFHSKSKEKKNSGTKAKQTPIPKG
jgi:hypothetical protein